MREWHDGIVGQKTIAYEWDLGPRLSAVGYRRSQLQHAGNI